MKISVIIPAYNSEDFIDKCLNSVLNNTYRNLEIICINDGSIDNTAEIINKYQGRDSRIIIINQDNKGVSVARNVGLMAATGELISFIDADDWIHPQYFEILIKRMVENKADVIAADRGGATEEGGEFKDVEENAIKVSILSKKELFSDRNIRYYVTGKLFRREIISGVFFKEGIHIAEDVLFNADILFNNPTIVVAKVNIPMYVYHDHYGSATHVYTYKEKYMSFLALYHKINHVGESNIFYDDYLTEIIKQALAMRYQCIIYKDKKNYKRKINRLIRKCLRQLTRKALKSKVVLTFFYLLPSIYRIFRIVDDPTLLIEEKKIKNRRNEKK